MCDPNHRLSDHRGFPDEPCSMSVRVRRYVVPLDVGQTPVAVSVDLARHRVQGVTVDNHRVTVRRVRDAPEEVTGLEMHREHRFR